MMFAGVIGLLVGTIIGGFSAKANILENAMIALRHASLGFKDFSNAKTDDDKQRLSMKLGTFLVAEGLKASAILAVGLLVFVAPFQLGVVTHLQQLVYVVASAISGALAFRTVARVSR